MDKFSSEATKAGFQEPEKPVSEMTEEELKRFRASFDPDMMGFDGTEGADEEEETDGLSTLFQTNFFRLFFRYCTGV